MIYNYTLNSDDISDDISQYKPINNTQEEITSENTIAWIVGISILSCSFLRACYKYTSIAKDKILNYKERVNLNNYINESQLEEQGTTLNNDICSICIDNFSPRQMSIVLHCNHKFHKKCILEWFKKELTCPMCRTSVYIN